MQITYDARQHCTAIRLVDQKRISMDCPYTGKGLDLSPTNLVEAALGGCMLISMGTYAIQHGIDLKGTRVNVEVTTSAHPYMHFSEVKVVFTMPDGIDKSTGKRLERAAETCPLKHSFAANVKIHTIYKYLLPA